MRAGVYGLSLLSAPLNVHVLKALAEAPLPLIDLRRAVGCPPQTTLRGHLKTLTKIGVLERRSQTDFPGSVNYGLRRSGHELLGVTEVLQAWLRDAPDGPQLLASMAAKGSTKTLVEAWSTSIVRAVAARPLSLTDLSKVISSLNYPSLERRLAALRLAGLVEASPGSGRGTPYAATRWLAQALGPLVAAARWEHRHIPLETSPLSRIDVEATFLLAVPMLNLGADISGTCRLAVELNGGGNGDPVGVVVGVRGGRVVSCVSRLGGEANAWVSGSLASWLDAVVQQEFGRLQIGGDAMLADAILDGLHRVLFRTPAGV